MAKCGYHIGQHAAQRRNKRVEQRLANFFTKEQNSNYFELVAHTVSVAATQLSYCGARK